MTGDPKARVGTRRGLGIRTSMGETDVQAEKATKEFCKEAGGAGSKSLSMSQNQKESERVGTKFALGRGVGVLTAPPTGGTAELQLADAAGDAESGVVLRHWPAGQPITGEKREAEMLGLPA